VERPNIVTPPPGPRSKKILARAGERMHHSFGPDQSVPFVVDHKDAWFLHDVDGNSYIDCVTAWGSTPLGSNHLDVATAVARGLERYSLENTDYVFAEPLLDLADRLVEISPASLTHVSYDVSGTEAVESAVKLMRESTGRPYVISFHGQYHGESYVGQSLSAQRSDFSPRMRHLTPGVLHVPFPHPYRCPFAHEQGTCDGTCVVDYIRDHMTFHVVAPDEIAGIVIEPILGEGGVLEPPAPFWPAIRRLCTDNGWLLCLDEVETGIGRTGEMFAADLWNVEPDIMCLAKALSGGGLPVAAVLMSNDVRDRTGDVHTGGTWAGQPAACLGAMASLDVYERDGVLDHVKQLDVIAHRYLDPLTDLPAVGEVRIRGTYIAIDMVTDPGTRKRAPHLARALHDYAVSHGVVGIQDDVAHYRILPALNMPLDLFAVTMETLVTATEHANAVGSS